LDTDLTYLEEHKNNCTRIKSDIKDGNNGRLVVSKQISCPFSLEKWRTHVRGMMPRYIKIPEPEKSM
jgi:hypothetical protein